MSCNFQGEHTVTPYLLCELQLTLQDKTYTSCPIYGTEQESQNYVAGCEWVIGIGWRIHLASQSEVNYYQNIRKFVELLVEKEYMEQMAMDSGYWNSIHKPNCAANHLFQLEVAAAGGNRYGSLMV